MSIRYKGAIISATPPTTTGGENGVASGAWTLEQQMQLIAAGLWPSQPPPPYVEDVFSTTLYIGNGASQGITNGINLSTNGGLIWFKPRNTGNNHNLIDNVRGLNKFLITNSTSAEGTASAGYGVTSFDTTGFTLGSPWTSSTNTTNTGYASYTFREKSKFFDIVTYTGNGTQGRSVSHNLGSAPGFMIVKRTDGVDNWRTYHRSLGGTKFMSLDTTAAAATSITLWNNADPTSTVFYLGNDASVNGNGMSYVAYLFAHNAGGFGLTETENVISCGSFSVASVPLNVNLGYEPQFVMVKSAGTESSWWMFDTMRNLSQTEATAFRAETTGVDQNLGTGYIGITSTGFSLGTSAGGMGLGTENIYIAIRRGPMAIPTDATKVYQPVTTANGTIQSGTVPVKDATINFALATPGWQISDRSRGITAGFTSNTSGNTTTNPFLITNSTAAESTSGCRVGGLGIARSIATAGTWFNGDTAAIANGNFDTLYSFQRAPSFFDVVCDTGTGVGRTINHNLGVVPQLMIRKRRNSTSNWCVYPNDITQVLFLDATNPFGTNGATYWNSTTPTSTVFSIGTNTDVNTSGGTYVTYLFATCPGVSKVGSYTGTGTTQTIDCGFTAGARFIMIKRTDASGDWYVWDSANGIVAGNDPYLLINSTAAQVTGTDYVDTAASGFELSSTAPAAINANGGSFIFLAIA